MVSCLLSSTNRPGRALCSESPHQVAHSLPSHLEGANVQANAAQAKRQAQLLIVFTKNLGTKSIYSPSLSLAW